MRIHKTSCTVNHKSQKENQVQAVRMFECIHPIARGKVRGLPQVSRGKDSIRSCVHVLTLTCPIARVDRMDPSFHLGGNELQEGVLWRFVYILSYKYIFFDGGLSFVPLIVYKTGICVYVRIF